MRRSLIVATTVLALASSAQAQDVLLRVGGQPGQSAKYQSLMEMWMSGGMMAMSGGDTTQPFMRRTAFVTRTVASVSGDTITTTEVTDSGRVETPAMPQMAAMMQQAAGIGQTVTTKMNDRGLIYSVAMDNPAGAGAGGPGQGATGGGRGRGAGGPGGGRGMMGGMGRGPRSFFLLPKDAVHVGQSWTDTMSVAGATPEEPSTSMAATYTLNRVDQRGGSRIAVVGMNGTVTMTGGPTGPQTMQMTGEFQLDVSAHKLSGMSMTTSGTINSPQGQVPMKMTMTQTPLP